MSSESRRGRKKPKHAPHEVVALARNWIALILQFTAHDTEDSFLANRERQLAVERCFAALGESLKDIPDDILAFEPNIPWEKSKGFRDIVAHDYWDSITQLQVWDTIQAYLPDLEAALARLEKRLK